MFGQDSHRSGFHRLLHVIVPVMVCTCDTAEQITRFDGARVVDHPRDLGIWIYAVGGPNSSGVEYGQERREQHLTRPGRRLPTD